MKAKFIIMSLALLMSMPLFARQRDTVIVGNGFHYVGKWPEGKGVLYSQKDGLVMGDFKKARPQGECVCYMPSGVLYWGQYNKSKATLQEWKVSWSRYSVKKGWFCICRRIQERQTQENYR